MSLSRSSSIGRVHAAPLRVPSRACSRVRGSREKARTRTPVATTPVPTRSRVPDEATLVRRLVRLGVHRTRAMSAAGQVSGDRDRLVGVVSQREQHARQRDAIGDAVVQARDYGRVAHRAVDQVELPRRARHVQRRLEQVADEVGEARLAVGHQSAWHDVGRQVEVRVVAPHRLAEPGPPPEAPAAGKLDIARRSAAARHRRTAPSRRDPATAAPRSPSSGCPERRCPATPRQRWPSGSRSRVILAPRSAHRPLGRACVMRKRRTAFPRRDVRNARGCRQVCWLISTMGICRVRGGGLCRTPWLACSHVVVDVARDASGAVRVAGHRRRAGRAGRGEPVGAAGRRVLGGPGRAGTVGVAALRAAAAGDPGGRDPRCRDHRGGHLDAVLAGQRAPHPGEATREVLLAAQVADDLPATAAALSAGRSPRRRSR